MDLLKGAARRDRRETTCRVMARHFDFLSVGEEFGADAADVAFDAHVIRWVGKGQVAFSLPSSFTYDSCSF